jgi:hypothetical protein
VLVLAHYAGHQIHLGVTGKARSGI